MALKFWKSAEIVPPADIEAASLRSDQSARNQLLKCLDSFRLCAW